MDRRRLESDLRALAELLTTLWTLVDELGENSKFRAEEPKLRKMIMLVGGIMALLSARAPRDVRPLLECTPVGMLPGLPLKRPMGATGTRRNTLDDPWLAKKKQQAALSALRGIVRHARKITRGFSWRTTKLPGIPDAELEAKWQSWLDFTVRLDRDLYGS